MSVGRKTNVLKKEVNTMERIIKEGRVRRSFNDKENNLKTYAKGDTFRAEDTRYFELFRQGFLSEGKAVTSKNSK